MKLLYSFFFSLFAEDKCIYNLSRKFNFVKISDTMRVKSSSLLASCHICCLLLCFQKCLLITVECSSDWDQMNWIGIELLGSNVVLQLSSIFYQM